MWLKLKVNLCKAQKKLLGTIKTFLKISNKTKQKHLRKIILKIQFSAKNKLIPFPWSRFVHDLHITELTIFLKTVWVFWVLNTWDFLSDWRTTKNIQRRELWTSVSIIMREKDCVIFRRLKEVFLKNKNLEIVLCYWSSSSPCAYSPSLKIRGFLQLNSRVCLIQVLCSWFVWL